MSDTPEKDALLPVTESGLLQIALVTLSRCKRMIDEALPQFNWGASALSADAIKLLNDVPFEVNRALKVALDSTPPLPGTTPEPAAVARLAQPSSAPAGVGDGEEIRERLASIVRQHHRTRNHRAEDDYLISFPTTHIGEYAAADAILAALRPDGDAGRERALEEALERAAGRLVWCATATPGCSHPKGEALALSWAEEARNALATPAGEQQS